MARITYDDRGTQRVLELGDETVWVGSADKCALSVEGPGVAGRHFAVERTKTGWRLRDGGSKSGTLVNGVPVESRRLRNGDRIQAGDAELAFENPRAGLAPAPAPSATRDAARRQAAADVMRLKTTLSALASETDFKKLLTLIVDQVISLTGAERGFLILRTDAKKYEMVAARTFEGENVRRPGFKISRMVAEEVARTGKPLNTTNAQTDARLADSESVEGMRLRSVLCLPLFARGEFLGFLYMDHRFEEGTFRSDHLELLEAFADQAAVALENTRLVDELRRRTEELARSKARVEELNRLLEQRVSRQRQELDEVRTLLSQREDAGLKYEYPNIVGSSARLREVLELVDHVTDTSVPVLILGESGTGKELIARAIHRNGPRKAAPFITENCAAIPENLLESVLFGHVKGAFTGADRDKIGLFEQAHGGTLFLDEIAELPLGLQVKLLRALESGELRKVGGKDTVKVDVRIISATNRDPVRMAAEGTFREDLLYRINVLQVRLPPLRERREDIPELVDHFLAMETSADGAAPKEITEQALALLCGYAWPGNVRQLRNEILRAVALSARVILPEGLSPEIRERSVPVPAAPASSGRSLKEIVQEAVDLVETRAVEDALRRTGWRKSDAARLLQVSRPTLDAKIKRHGLRPAGSGRPAVDGG